jgi:hypothetical protein
MLLMEHLQWSSWGRISIVVLITCWLKKQEEVYIYLPPGLHSWRCSTQREVLSLDASYFEAHQ